MIIKHKITLNILYQKHYYQSHSLNYRKLLLLLFTIYTSKFFFELFYLSKQELLTRKTFFAAKNILLTIQQYMDDQNSSQTNKVKAFKVILVGSQSVGKSSILNRISDGRFSNNYTPTIGIDFKTYSVDIGTKVYSLQIWDTAGQQKFRALTSSYYKGAHGCVCVFDLSDSKSLQKCDYYIDKALQENIPKECIYLIGNKSDLGDLQQKQGEEFADKYQINYGVGSAKNGDGLTAIFNNLTSKMVSKFGGDLPKQGMELKPKLVINERQGCKC